jgi:tetratricopeptide (TPR) repeat protein
MEAWSKIIAGLFFLFFSLGYLYRPAFVLRVNAWARSLLFNDTVILLYRRRVGLFFFACAILFFYSGFLNLAHHLSARKPSTYLELSDAHRAFRDHEYKGAVVRCQNILKREPDNVHAWALLAYSWGALGRDDQSKRAWEQVLRIEPDHPMGPDASEQNSLKGDSHR